MTQQQKDQPRNDEQQRQAIAGENFGQDVPVQQQSGAVDDTGDTSDAGMPPTNDAGDAISEDSLYDASGAATGGGVDTPNAVMNSTEDAVKKQKPIDQGSSAYMGGGADNGSNL